MKAGLCAPSILSCGKSRAFPGPALIKLGRKALWMAAKLWASHFLRSTEVWRRRMALLILLFINYLHPSSFSDPPKYLFKILMRLAVRVSGPGKIRISPAPRLPWQVFAKKDDKSGGSRIFVRFLWNPINPTRSRSGNGPATNRVPECRVRCILFGAHDCRGRGWQRHLCARAGAE